MSQLTDVLDVIVSALGTLSAVHLEECRKRSEWEMEVDPEVASKLREVMDRRNRFFGKHKERDAYVTFDR